VLWSKAANKHRIGGHFRALCGLRAGGRAREPTRGTPNCDVAVMENFATDRRTPEPIVNEAQCVMQWLREEAVFLIDRRGHLASWNEGVGLTWAGQPRTGSAIRCESSMPKKT